MSQKYSELEQQHCEFVAKQHVFFVGSAAADGLVNVSPKGMDSLRVLGPNRLVWLNLTGSGNETAAHIRELPRMTIMFCSFDKQPLILRVYGRAKVIYPGQPDWPELIRLFPEYTGARQLFDLQIELVQTSCGFAVPFYEFKAERDTLTKWADGKGTAGIESYWSEKNLLSLDGKETGIDKEC